MRVKACGGNPESEERKMAMRKEKEELKLDFSGEKPATPLLDTINHPIHMKNLGRKVSYKKIKVVSLSI